MIQLIKEEEKNEDKVEIYHGEIHYYTGKLAHII